MTNSNLLYPPVKVVRQNQTHVFRVLIRSREMIDFLQKNYATPINRDTEYCYFDININSDKTGLSATTNADYLEIVDGEDNPRFKREARVMGASKRRKEDKDLRLVNKKQVFDRIKPENRLFIGKVTHVFPAEIFEKRDGAKAALRRFICEQTINGFTQSALFEIYRGEKWMDKILDGFKISVGDYLKVEYYMEVVTYPGHDGIPRYYQKNKVYRSHFMVDPLTKEFSRGNDNPFEERIDISLGDDFLSEKEKQLLENRNKE